MSQPATVTIRVDTNQRGKIIRRLEDIEDAQLEFGDLDRGDYELPTGVRVARKSATDLILGVVEKTLWDEVAALRSEAERVVYVIEGDLYTARFHQQPLDVHRALSHMIIVQGAWVLPSPDAEHSGMLIYLLARAAQDGGAPFDRIQKPEKRRDGQRYLLTALPGIDTDRANNLLRHFKSARAVLAASAEELAEVDGIDSELAERVSRMLDYAR